ncbi:MAG: response regulator transcription factor [Coriobacteriales bacterium]|jgi:two-component system response regulator VicR|nr:response regulator transcription factor [Coriobacteriales bacterium]
MRILLADDDSGMQTLVSHIVREAGHEIIIAKDGDEAFALYERERPDLLIVDVMMPKLNGFELTTRLRERKATTPIILLTAKGDIVDKTTGFKAGADDYLVKPFIPQELQLRIEALLRRGTGGRKRGYLPDVLTFDGLEIEARKRRVIAHGTLTELTPKEFHLLYMMACNPGIVFTREQLIEDIWGPDYVGEITGITVLIHRIREKIEADPHNPRYIQTVWHVGYRFGD